MRKEYNYGDTQRQLPLAPIPRHMAITMEAMNSLSLSLTMSLYTRAIQLLTTKNATTTLYVCPKSYLYTYDFRAFYAYGPKAPTRTHLHMCPFQFVGRNTTGP